MKKVTLFLLMSFLALANQAFAQEEKTTVISGVVTDNSGLPLPAADILIKGTSKGTTTDFDGKFEIESDTNTGSIIVSFVGYLSKEISYASASKNYFNIKLQESSVGLEEVEIFSSRVIDRKTPVAASTISKEEIEVKLGNQEFVEVFKSTPGVYATKDSGGFGDGEILIRGFQSRNVAVLINGIPVNDIEDGRVFWSNWAGIGNVTSSTQTQRGLGAAKIAAPSIGGTINIITESTDAEKGGNVTYSLGNDGYTKYGLKLSTGLMENGWAATVYADRTFGDGYIDGTPFDAVTYFGTISKKINDQHRIVLTGTGAPQQHGTRFLRAPIQTYRDNERGIRLNQDWGIRNGEVFSLSRNQFHKPLISLNHYWRMNDYNKLSTALYYSGGIGGITFDSNASNFDSNADDFRLGDLGPVDVDAIVKENQEAGESKIFLESRTSKDLLIGGISTYNSSISDELDISGGLDIRYGESEGGRKIADLLGGSFLTIENRDANVNDPRTQLRTGDKFGFFNKSIVRVAGAFAQAEYDTENTTIFGAINLANTSYKREDRFDIANGDPNQKTDWVNFFTYGAKGGFNYRIDKQHNVFFNGGYFERAPFFNAIWPTNNNTETNTEAENQKIFSLELGYGLRTKQLALNFNIYRTNWLDRTETRNRFEETQGGRTRVFDNISGINALHQGVELDFEYRPFDFLSFTGMLSVGDWRWQDDVSIIRLDENQEVIDKFDFLIADLPVGRSAQTTSALGLRFKATPQTTLYIDYNYFDRYYSDFNPNDDNRIVDPTLEETDPAAFASAIEEAKKEPYELPDYGLFDASIQHKFKVGSLDASIIARMNNVFNIEYITRADDGDNRDPATESGTAAGTQVFFGTGRTFSISTKVNF